MSCKKSTELIEKSKIASLSLKEKLYLRLHLAMCSPCTKYSKLSDQIDTLIKAGFNKENETDVISEKRKKEIISILNQIEH